MLLERMTSKSVVAKREGYLCFPPKAISIMALQKAEGPAVSL